MTFPGEAVALDWVNGLPDSGDDLRDLDDATTTLATGGDIVIGFYDYRYLTATDAAEFTLAVEATSGSATVDVAWGFDPAWSLDTSAATTSAGAHTLAAGITAIPLTGVSAAQYHAQTDELAVRVTVTSGSVDVDQIRLRVWPPGGPVGAWSPTQTADPIVFKPTIAKSVWSGYASMEATISAAQTTARADAAADPIGSGGGGTYPPDGATSIDVGHWGSSVNFSASVIDPGTGPQAEAAVQGAQYAYGFASYVGEPTGVEGVDWVYPPDSTRKTQEVGERTIDWTQPIMTIAASPTQFLIGGGTDTTVWYPGPFTIGPGEAGVKPTGPASTYTINTPSGDQGSAIARQGYDIDVSAFETTAGGRFNILPNGLFYEESVIYSGDFDGTGGTDLFIFYGKATPSGDPALYTGEDVDIWTNFQPLEYVLTPAPFRYWDPAGVDELIPMRIRQRGDGLGMGSPRVRGTASRQRSTRVRGHY